ncbi:MAG TPA: hypothetical protein VJ770_18065 [Stellaceae bacterium]|nr:hypothetical protein [Stellaceae bacterium]
MSVIGRGLFGKPPPRASGSGPTIGDALLFLRTCAFVDPLALILIGRGQIGAHQVLVDLR